MTSRSIKEIKYELKKVDEIIQSKQMLKKDFPQDYGLRLSLKNFEIRKEDLISELTDAKNKYNIVSFDLSLYALNKELITLNVLGDISNKFNDLIRSFLMTITGPIKKELVELKN